VPAARRWVALLLGLALAACAREGPPAPVVQCRSYSRVVEIDGAAQRAYGVYCRDDRGEARLR
jgi:surface antigen